MPRRAKGQHFLLSAAARTLALAAVLRLSDREAETVFAAIRWADSDGRPVCPDCGGGTCYDCRRANGAPRWRCKACRKDFSLTSGTLFAFHKLALRVYLAAIVIFLNEVKGKSALALSRDLGVQYKTAFVLAHKIREAMASETKGLQLGGAGRAVEVDGAYFGGHVRPENRKQDRRDRRLAENQTGKRQCVVVVRERALDGTSRGRTIANVFNSEDAALDFIKIRVDRASTVHADEAGAWNELHARFEPRRVFRRLPILRGWSHGEEDIDEICVGGPGASGTDGAGAPGRPWVAMGGDWLDRGEDRLHRGDAALLGSAG